MRRMFLILCCVAGCSPGVETEKTTTAGQGWPGAESTLDGLAPFTATVIACTAKGDAEIVARNTLTESTIMHGAGGEEIRGGGVATHARCRQEFRNIEVLHGDANAEDRVLEYGYTEKSDVHPGPPAGKPIPRGAKVILVLGKEGNLMKALPDTEENRDAVRSALARHQEKQKSRKDAQPGGNGAGPSKGK